MENFSKAEKSMIPALKAIWAGAFGDSEAYIDFIFEKLLANTEVMVLAGAAEPLAMLCAQEIDIVYKGRDIKAHYIFGVATRKDCQGRGLSSRLLLKTHEYLKSTGSKASVLVPAGESLFNFYGARGYEVFSGKYQLSVKAGDIKPQEYSLNAQPLTAGEFYNLRESINPAGVFVRFAKSYTDYILEECVFVGGNAFKFKNKGDFFAVCYPYGDKVFIKELYTDAQNFGGILCFLNEYYGAGEYIFTLNKKMGEENGVSCLPFSMIKWYDKNAELYAENVKKEDVYIAHVLD